MASRRNSKGQERLNSIIQLYNDEAKTEKLRKRLRELDGQICQHRVPTGRLQLIDYLTDALFEERHRSESFKRERDWWVKEAFDAKIGEHRAQGRANQNEAFATALVRATIPVIVSLTDTIRTQNEAARNPLPILEYGRSAIEIGRSIGRNETYQEVISRIERINDKLHPWQFPTSRSQPGKEHANIKSREDSTKTPTTEKPSLDPEIKSKMEKGTRKAIYSEGELNLIIDSFMHPIAEKDAKFWVLDGMIHGLIEKNPSNSVRKFITYSLPRLLSQIIMNDRHSKDELEFILRRIFRLAREAKRTGNTSQPTTP